MAYGAAPAVERLEVNGYTVYLVNTGRGNTLSVGANVMTGAWHDPVHLAGRAHLLEHVLFLGSLRFPGRHSFEQISRALGAESNAYTSLTNTYYYGVVHRDSFHQWTQVLGDMITQPLIDAAAIPSERDGPVLNEMQSGLDRDSEAFDAAMLITLLPEGHPFAMLMLGTREQLEAQGAAELRQLYESRYRPENTQIIVSGNLDGVDREALLQSLRTGFKARTPALPAPAPRQIPPLSPEGNARFFEYEANTDTRHLRLFFDAGPAPTGVERAAVDVLATYLRSSDPGSLFDMLAEKGWVYDLSVQEVVVDGRLYFDVNFELHDDGVAHRQEIPDYFFAELARVRDRGLPAASFDHVVGTAIQAEAVEESMAVAEHLISCLENGIPENRCFEAQRRFESVTVEQVSAAVSSCFSVDRMIAGYMGPEIQGENQIFGRSYRVSDEKASFSRWRRILRQGRPSLVRDVALRVPEVPLAVRASPLRARARPPRLLPLSLEGVQASLEENHGDTTGAMDLYLQLPLLPRRSEAALQIFLLAFNEKYSGQVSYLFSHGVEVELEGKSSALRLQASGNVLSTRDGALWLLDALKSYRPTKGEIESAQATWELSFHQSGQGFPGHIAHAHAQSLVTPGAQLNHELSKSVRSLTAPEVRERVGAAFANADLTAAFSGDFSAGEVEHVLGQVRERFAAPLTERQRARWAKQRPQLNEEAAYFSKRMLGTRRSRLVGVSRVFGSADVGSDLRRYAALAVVVQALDRAVYAINRTEGGLGYLQRAQLHTVAGRAYIMLYGQTNDDGNLRKIERGWQRALALLEEGQLSTDGFISERDGLIRMMRRQAETAAASAARTLASLLQSGQPDFRERVLQEMATLTMEEIRQAGLDILRSEAPLTVLHGLRPSRSLECAEWLSTAGSTRRRARGGG